MYKIKVGNTICKGTFTKEEAEVKKKRYEADGVEVEILDFPSIKQPDGSNIISMVDKFDAEIGDKLMVIRKLEKEAEELSKKADEIVDALTDDVTAIAEVAEVDDIIEIIKTNRRGDARSVFGLIIAVMKRLGENESISRKEVNRVLDAFADRYGVEHLAKHTLEMINC